MPARNDRSRCSRTTLTVEIVTCLMLLATGCTDSNSSSGAGTGKSLPPGAPELPDELVPSREGAYPPPNIAAISAVDLWTDYVDTESVARTVMVTLKNPSDSRGFYDGRVLISSADYAAEKSYLLESTRGLDLLEDRTIELSNGADLPTFTAHVSSEAALEQLQVSPYVDYIEPAPLALELAADSLACGTSAYVPSTDPRARDDRLGGQYAGEDLVPYAYKLMHVDEAWKRFAPAVYSKPFPGQNQGIAILDTGVASRQSQFFDRYEAHFPRGRFLRLDETGTDIDDTCSHGTKVASIAGAPRDGRSIVGIAWDSRLMSFKVTGSPAPLPPSAFTTLADWVCQGIENSVRPPDGQPPAKVVAMAFGLLYVSPVIQECIANAFKRSPTTVFVAAAGTKEPKVVFPANLDEYVVAVSMVGLDPKGSGYRQLGYLDVAYGSSVDFVAAYDHATQLPAAGLVSEAEGGTDEVRVFCCSSAATAMYAGLIALASQYGDEQGWNREQLMSALTLASSRKDIAAKDSGEATGIGAGLLDEYLATGGARNASISAPREIAPGQEARLEGSVDAVIPPGARAPRHFRFNWFVNGSAVDGEAVARVNAPQSGTMEVELRVEDLVDGKTLLAQTEIRVVPRVSASQRKLLYWSSYVGDYATFFNGGRNDHIVNEDVFLPLGCEVLSVKGLAMVAQDSAITPMTGMSPVESWSGSGAGFTLARPQGIPSNSLETLVHQWHDGFSAVRTKLLYEIDQPAGFNCELPGVLQATP
jgi:Subtilase family